MTSKDPGLSFSEAAHRYWLDGKPVKGVTTLIKAGLPAPALMKWGPRLVADYVIDNWPDVADSYRHDPEKLRWELRGLPDAKRDEAGIRGSEIHAIAEDIIHDRPADVPDRLLPYVNGYVDWLDSWGVQPIITEQGVASRRHWYAGRVDCIATIARSGIVAGLDWKTSRGVYGSTALQLAAYVRAEFTVADDPTVELPIPDVDCTLVVHITDHGTEAHWLGRSRAEIDEAFRDFLAVAAVAKRVDRIDGHWDSKLRKAVGGYLSDPIELEAISA